jgi:hypothetical protein
MATTGTAGRRRVSVDGRRVRVIDMHAHVAVAEPYAARACPPKLPQVGQRGERLTRGASVKWKPAPQRSQTMRRESFPSARLDSRSRNPVTIAMVMPLRCYETAAMGHG